MAPTARPSGPARPAGPVGLGIVNALEFGRGVCNDLQAAGQREWLVTNGIGGYASGTICGLLSRRYHGLLIAALRPPLGRTLLLAKLDETARYDGETYPLFANCWPGGSVEPTGFVHLESFHLEDSTPVWRFACADALLERRVWMILGENTSCVRYDLVRGTNPLMLTVDALANHRDHHGNTRAAEVSLAVESELSGIRIHRGDENGALHLWADAGQVEVRREWTRSLYLSMEEYRGLDPLDQHLHAARFTHELQPGHSLTIVASTLHPHGIDSASAYAARRAHDGDLVKAAEIQAQSSLDMEISSGGERSDVLLPAWVSRLVLAADQFLVRRATDSDPDGRTVIAGYPWFEDWGRDTMVSLPGLTLTTGRKDEAASILRTFARYVDRGMLPNRFPESGGKPAYNTVDAALWYFEALRAYVDFTDDRELLEELFPVLEGVIAWHQQGTRYNIRLDPADGLLYAGDESVQLTWMDAKVGDWVVTPRIGKPVEINALWYNALRSMADWAPMVSRSADRFEAFARHARNGFARFWNHQQACCFDVLDGPEGSDASIRPNQLLAVSLPHSPLESWQQRAVVDLCGRRLWTSQGLRSLDMHDPAYVGVYRGDQRSRDVAYHQGTVWGWLIGPFVSAHWRVYRDREAALSFLRPLAMQLEYGGLGTLNEIFDGDPPHAPRGCIAQAWSVAEALRVWQLVRRWN